MNSRGQLKFTLMFMQGTKGEWARFNTSVAYTKNVISSVGYHQNFTKESMHALIYR